VKYRTLRWVAAVLGVMVWLVLAVGVLTSILIGVAAETTMARVGILLGGLASTAVSALVLLGISRLLCLFIDIEQDLRDIKARLEEHLGH